MPKRSFEHEHNATPLGMLTLAAGLAADVILS